MFPLPSFCLCFQFRHAAHTGALPSSPITAKTSQIHQRQQPLHLSTDAAASTVWTHGWIYLTRRQRPLITKSAPRVWAPKTFWQDLIYAHHQLEEALSSVILLRLDHNVILGWSDLDVAAMSKVWAELRRPPPSTCLLCASSCVFDSFLAPGGPVADNLIIKSGYCKFADIGCVTSVTSGRAC